jgi:hypothetical protein
LEVSQKRSRTEAILCAPDCTPIAWRIMASVQGGQHGDLTSKILHALDPQESLLSAEAFPTVKSADIKSALDRLGSRSMVTYETIDREEPVLQAEGQDITANGSHEARVFEALQNAMEGLTMAELEKAVGDKNIVKVGQMRAFGSGWIKRGKEGRFVAAVCPTSTMFFLPLTSAERLNYGQNSRTTADNPKQTCASRSESSRRSEETEACQNAKGYKLQDIQGSEIRIRDGQGRN